MDESITRRRFLRDCGKTAFSARGALFSPALPALASPGRRLWKKGVSERCSRPILPPLGKGLIRCELCPHGCEVAPGERGLCEVRENIEREILFAGIWQSLRRSCGSH